MGNYIYDAGFKSYQDFILKVVFPTIGVMLLFLFIMVFYIKPPLFTIYIILVLGLAFIAVFPYLRFERRKVSIQENIHLYVTYAGTLSTLKLNVTTLLKKISEEKEYGELATMSDKIVYLSKNWNLGYARTCRLLASHSPSKIFGDFLDRFAAVLDFGEDIEVFLTQEQDAVMDDFANEYNKSLENIRMLQDIFISLTIAIAFAMSAALLLPLLMGISIMVIIRFSLIGLFVMDMMLVVLIKTFIPSDKLCHNLLIIDEGTKKLLRAVVIILPLSFLITASLIYIDKLTFLFSVAIGFTPLIIIGMFASAEENMVFRRDKAFPTFIRAMGGTIATKGGGPTSSLGSLRVHDFGVLNTMLVNLYRRLRLGSERFLSWIYFAGESGSNLINYFIHIFAKSIYLGGDGVKIGEIISKNFFRLISLRKLRIQLASALRGALYGALLGFLTTVYMATAITFMLSGMFSSAFESAQMQQNMSNLVTSILPVIPTIDMNEVNIYIGVIVIIHSLISAIIIKIVDGGNKYAAMFDFVLMIWLGAALSWAVPKLARWAFGNLTV